MKTLTIITTTFNRGYCIGKLYNSLVEQKCKDFLWLVIDDGSTDDTKDIIQKFFEESLIEIEYYYKTNGGMHTARNLAYSKVHTELNTIIDSDDWVAPNAVQIIIDFWKKNKRKNIAGIISLNADPSGKVIGTSMPKGIEICSYRDFFHKYQMRGDKKLIYRSELTKLYPFPEFEGEKFYPAAYKYYMIDKKYDMLLLNQICCIVDYNEDSMTRDKYAQYKQCPNGFMHYRKKMLELDLGIKENVKNMIHYIMESKMLGSKSSNMIPPFYLYCLCYLPGVALFYYISKTKRKY